MIEAYESSNPQLIQTQQIHGKFKESESHQIFLSLSLYLKNGKFKTEKGKFKFFSNISREKCQK